MTVVKRYLTRDKDSRDLRDGHSNAEFYDKAIRPSDEFKNRLLRELRVDRALLGPFSLAGARAWYDTAPETLFHGYAPAPNPSYLTLSKRVKRDLFISNGIGRSHGSIFSLVKPSSVSW